MMKLCQTLTVVSNYSVGVFHSMHFYCVGGSFSDSWEMPYCRDAWTTLRRVEERVACPYLLSTPDLVFL